MPAVTSSERQDKGIIIRLWAQENGWCRGTYSAAPQQHTAIQAICRAGSIARRSKTIGKQPQLKGLLLALTCPELRNHVLQPRPHEDALKVALPLSI